MFFGPNWPLSKAFQTEWRIPYRSHFEVYDRPAFPAVSMSSVCLLALRWYARITKPVANRYSPTSVFNEDPFGDTTGSRPLCHGVTVRPVHAGEICKRADSWRPVCRATSNRGGHSTPEPYPSPARRPVTRSVYCRRYVARYGARSRLCIASIFSSEQASRPIAGCGRR
jgi:hypothetical protein